MICQTIREVKEKKGMLILEWVKGHENMKEEIHNGTSKMKMLGNEIADEEAKLAVEKGTEEQDFEIDSRLTIRDSEGYRMTERGVIKKMKMLNKEERRKRLEKTAEEVKWEKRHIQEMR